MAAYAASGLERATTPMISPGSEEATMHHASSKNLMQGPVDPEKDPACHDTGSSSPSKKCDSEEAAMHYASSKNFRNPGADCAATGLEKANEKEATMRHTSFKKVWQWARLPGLPVINCNWM